MCRMIAFHSASPLALAPFLEALAHQSRCGVNSPHGDGFGFAVWRGGHWLVIREQCAVHEAELSELGQLTGTIALLHSRKASDKDTINFTKLHPFCGMAGRDSLVFCHNGTINNHEAIASDAPPGSIDTEKYAALFFAAYKHSRNTAAALKTAAQQVLESGATVTSINAFASDGHTLAAYKGPVLDPSYHTLHTASAPGLAVVSTETFEYPALADWLPLEEGTIVKLGESS